MASEFSGADFLDELEASRVPREQARAHASGLPRWSSLDERMSRLERQMDKLEIDMRMQRWTFTIAFGLMISLQGVVSAKLIYP